MSHYKASRFLSFSIYTYTHYVYITTKTTTPTIIWECFIADLVSDAEAGARGVAEVRDSLADPVSVGRHVRVDARPPRLRTPVPPAGYTCNKTLI